MIRAVLTGMVDSSGSVHNWAVAINNVTYNILLQWYQDDTGQALGPPANAVPAPPTPKSAPASPSVVQMRKLTQELWFRILMIAVASLVALVLMLGSISVCRRCCCMPKGKPAQPSPMGTAINAYSTNQLPQGLPISTTPDYHVHVGASQLPYQQVVPYR